MVGSGKQGEGPSTTPEDGDEGEGGGSAVGTVDSGTRPIASEDGPASKRPRISPIHEEIS